jgi:CDP-diacylglycerol--serine O-phosphatidyltransferase
MFKQLLKLIPNLLTLSNMMCGIIGIHMIGDISTIEPNFFLTMYLLKFAIYMIFLGAIFDFFDGFAAKAFNAHSELGKILDSLADLITFGLLPAYILHKLLIISTYSGIDKFNMPLWCYAVPLTLPCFTAYRLARFSVNSTITHFQGLSSTAAGLCVASIVLAICNDISMKYLQILFIHNYSIAIFSIILSVLMVSSIRFISLKFTSYGLKGNELRYLFIICSIVSILSFKWNGGAILFLLYLLFSLINHFFEKRRKTLN